MLNWTSWMYCTWKGCVLSQYSLVLKSSPKNATGPNPLSGVTTFLLQRNVASRILITCIAWVCLKFCSKIAYDSKYGTSRIDCARKMSSIFRTELSWIQGRNFPHSSDRYFLPSSLPFTPYFSSNVIPPLLCLFLPPLFLSLSYKGRL